MKLYSYVVARDFGFAPNPFFGFCTLSTCKPQIRKHASIGDWVIGTGAASYGYRGRLIYAMCVDEVLNFDEYWDAPRFFLKRPNLTGSLKVMYGDNIYHREGGRWMQADSHHSLPDGSVNNANLVPDTGVNRLLIATKFVYWGRSAPIIPSAFRHYGPIQEDICCPGRGQRNRFKSNLPQAFIEWLERENTWGVQGEPLEFARHKRQTLLASRSAKAAASTGSQKRSTR